MNQNRIKLGIEKAIQELGTPVMDYSPIHANLERQIIIEKVVTLLFMLRRDLEQDNE